MSLSAWYSSQYSSWNRTRRLQQPQFLARTDTDTSRAAAAMAHHDHTAPNADSPAQNSPRNKKGSDPLFGPNIGPCSAGPAWTTTASRKKLITDDLTPEVLAGWVEKSKLSSQPTTTLQALVNLKRPSLRLSPLSTAPEDSQSPLDPSHQHLHGLEFEYDCDAPKCGIYVHVVLSKTHPEAASVPSATNQAQILVFESVSSGGFGKRLTLEEGAMLELGRYDHAAQMAASAPENEEPAKSEVALESVAIPSDMNTSNRQSRRRFSHFPFRRRTNRSVAGPALAVVDNDPNATGNEAKKDKDKDDIEGIRVIIRLAALDEQGTELVSPNEQTTFLHIVRLGAKAAEPASENTDTDDSKPWIVKVVKREATIGPHTFQLHEIYGLTSSANTATSDVHTYPPQATGGDEEDPSSECLLCLSSPREVVLIPCRHLVACKECALNMVEFGAGGNLTHTTEPTVPVPAAVAEGGSVSTPGTGPSEPAVPIIPSTTATRRKRKAKGWFCPVCRQPYTSLLRISTAAPPIEKRESNTSGDGTHNHATTPGNGAMGGDVAENQDSNGEQRTGGILELALEECFFIPPFG
ncbi:hypothetical protein Agabi119p4_8154 [Agaricus bisporus var. burnettii]|uniref:RING-type domain-containing protein n=1 Tax=Agaricus bisporus var. burnettii TaxID=192524 RepID=A0A8H7EY36_AGABI|nr:hypothetical protein Agabi119p4_8154 [Agaricus bisporus var. burnettii]